MSKTYPITALILLMRKECEMSSLRKVAARYGISPAYLSDMIRGNRAISERVAAILGFDKNTSTVTTFTKKDKQ